MFATLRPCRRLWWESERRGCPEAGARTPTIACGADPEELVVNKSSTGRPCLASGLVAAGNAGIADEAQVTLGNDGAGAAAWINACEALVFPSRPQGAAVNTCGAAASFLPPPGLTRGSMLSSRCLVGNMEALVEPEHENEEELVAPSPSGATAGSGSSMPGAGWVSHRRNPTSPSGPPREPSGPMREPSGAAREVVGFRPAPPNLRLWSSPEAP